MGDQILIRDVPPRVRTWIESERRARKMSQKEFVIEALEKASEGGQPTLFDDAARRPQPIPDSVPFTFIDLCRHRRSEDRLSKGRRQVRLHLGMG